MPDFSAFVLEAMGSARPPPSTTCSRRCRTCRSAYMTMIEGWAHTRWGAGGMLHVEAAICMLAILVFIAVATLMTRARAPRTIDRVTSPNRFNHTLTQSGGSDVNAKQQESSSCAADDRARGRACHALGCRASPRHQDRHRFDDPTGGTGQRRTSRSAAGRSANSTRLIRTTRSSPTSRSANRPTARFATRRLSY